MSIKILPNDPTWKQAPFRIYGPSISSCCHQPSIIVQSRSGGFVTQNCTNCGYRYEYLGEFDYINEVAFLIKCPYCLQTTCREVLPDKNYGFACHDCNIGLRLAAIIPDYEDLIRDAQLAIAV